MEVQRQKDDLHLIAQDRLVDKFISDVLLPSTQHSHRSRDIYETFLDYCNTIEVGSTSMSFFSRHLKKRFQSRKIHGNLEFFCMLRPELTESQEN